MSDCFTVNELVEYFNVNPKKRFIEGSGLSQSLLTRGEGSGELQRRISSG